MNNLFRSTLLLAGFSLALIVVAACSPISPITPATSTPDPAVYNVVPDTTVYEPGQCSVVLDAPTPAYTSNTLSGQPSGEIQPGSYEVGVAADYGSRVFFMLNDVPPPANWIDSASASSLEGLCADS